MIVTRTIEYLYVSYHPQTNGEVERYNRTILAMLRNYVKEHQDDWDRYATALTYAYNNHVNRSIGTTPFSLLLSRPPPEFSLHHSIRSRARPTQDKRNDYVRRLDDSIQRLHKTPHNSSMIRTGLRQKDTNDTRTNQTRRLRIHRPYGRTIENRKTTFARNRTLPCATKRRQELCNRPRRGNRTQLRRPSYICPATRGPEGSTRN